jgi:hypothetical protein
MTNSGPCSIDLSRFDTIAYVKPNCCKKSKGCGCNIIIFENVLSPTGSGTGSGTGALGALNPSFNVETFDPVPVLGPLSSFASQPSLSSGPTDSWLNVLTGDVFKYVNSYWIKIGNLKSNSSLLAQNDISSDAFSAQVINAQPISLPESSVSFGSQSGFTNANFDGIYYTTPFHGRFNLNTQLEFYANSVGTGLIKIEFVVDNSFNNTVVGSINKTLTFALNTVASQNIDSASFSLPVELNAGDRAFVRVTVLSSPFGSGLGVNSPNSYFSGFSL